MGRLGCEVMEVGAEQVVEVFALLSALQRRPGNR